jgi:feruloyl-CoA synthase
MPDILPSETILDERPDGTIYARSPVPLGPYPAKLTERLERWADRTPATAFMARRDASGAWRRLTYGDALLRVRSIAQSLLDRGLSADKPLVILSGNSLEHALLALGAMYAGVPYAPLAPAYALLARDYTTLRHLWRALRPGMVFADDGPLFERALSHVAQGTEIVACTPPASLASTGFDDLVATPATSSVDEAHARVTPDTIAKILYTSGSTGRPKGVINTQRMLCSNQEMLRTVMPMLSSPPPILCDWLPWNHTFGGNHNVGIVLYNGGTLYIDDGKPVPGAFDTTIANLREIRMTAYFNVPKGYDMLVPYLREDAAFRTHFFDSLGMLFCAAAALRQQVADDIMAMAVDGRGRRIPLVTGLGATESAPFALCAGDSDFSGGRIGVPAPGVELKVAPVGRQLEARLKGPSITPGYWRDDELTSAAFDEEGYYKLGDALGFYDAADHYQGFTFEGRLSEDFKLSTGTWVRVGPLRQRFLAQFGDIVQDVVIAGEGRDEVTALVFPAMAACRVMAGASAGMPARDVLLHANVREAFAKGLARFVEANAGSSTSILRLLLLEAPPSIDAQETTDKGSVNQRAVLANRAALVDQLYSQPGDGILIDIEHASAQPAGSRPDTTHRNR